MFKNYLKTAWRYIVRQKGYSFINVFGLAVGMTCCLLIMLWVQNELSFDRFHEKGERIYRVVQELTLNAQNRKASVTSAAMGPAVTQAIPEAKQAVRVVSMGDTSVKYGEKEFRGDRFLFADPGIFSVFNFPLLAGHPLQALVAPYTAVISEKTARKYFGSENPIGKVLKLGSDKAYTVTGVMKNVPRNSHLKFDALCSFATYVEENKEAAEQWGQIGAFTYFLLVPGADSRSFLAKLNRLSDAKIGNDLRKIGGSIKVSLQPLRDIHLRSDFEMDIAETGDVATVVLFTVVALFILLIACINFVNLTTARFANRSVEVGLKKTMGATRGSLMRQFFAETFVVAFLAAFLALLFTALALRLLNSISGEEFPYSVLWQPLFLLSVVFFTVLVGVLAGCYPALYLSSFAPVHTLKGKLKAGAASATFRRLLVVGQFAISIALIIGTLAVFQQLRFLRNKHLGFNKEQVLVMPLPDKGGVSPLTARDEFAAVPGIAQAALSSDVPGLKFSLRNFVPEGRTEKEAVLMQTMAVDHRFLDTLGMILVRGRNFSANMQTDPTEAVIINETAAVRLGWPDPLGKTLDVGGRSSEGKRVPQFKKIVGVVKDFHTRSLREKIEPLVINGSPAAFQILSLRFAGQRLPALMAALKETWGGLFPGVAFDSFFLDERFARMYQAEERLNKIFTSFAILAVFISCLGLFGLAAYMTERRTKEVGIRKVLGAPISGIVILLSREFIMWVLVANLISWPLAYVFLSRWLRGFAYQTDLGIAVFAVSGLLALAIAWVTVGWQAVRAARANPVDSLRYE